MTQDQGKTSSGLNRNTAALLCYLLGFVTGIIFILIEKDSRFVRFHAFQSTIVFGALFIANIVLDFIPILGWILNSLLGIVGFILWIVLMYKAFHGEYYKLPYAGDLAEQQLNK